MPLLLRLLIINVFQRLFLLEPVVAVVVSVDVEEASAALFKTLGEWCEVVR